MISHLPVESIMRSGVPVHCPPETPLQQAAHLMTEHRCSSIVIMDQGEPLGIWTERDALLVNFASPEAIQRPVSEVMTAPVATLPVGTLINDVAMRFRLEGRRHFLVTGPTGQVVGIVSQSDIAMNQGLEPYLRLREVHAALNRAPLTLSGETRLSTVARHMHQSSYDAVIISCDVHGPGVLTERDILRFISDYPGDTRATELASRPLQSIDMNEPLIRARDLLLEKRLRHLGVTSSEGELVGLLGLSDLIAGVEHMYLEDLRATLEKRDAALAQSRRNLQLAEQVIEASLEGVIITDPDLKIRFVNPAFVRLTGYRPEEVIGRSPSVLSSGRHNAAFYKAMWDTLLATGHWRGEVWNRRKDGELFLGLLTITTIRDDDGNISHYAGLFTDITQARLNEERIRQLAYYDALTRLPNRRLLEDRLQQGIRRAHRKRNMLALMFVDLDHFKSINDNHGHATGDHLLTQIAERLQNCLREDDTLARLGGDEFIVLLPELDTARHAVHVAERLIEANARPYRHGDIQLRVGTSIGISLYPVDGVTAEELMEAADAAMYQAKSAGRNQFRLAENVPGDA